MDFNSGGNVGRAQANVLASDESIGQPSAAGGRGSPTALAAATVGGVGARLRVVLVGVVVQDDAGGAGTGEAGGGGGGGGGGGPGPPWLEFVPPS